ncbi:hypothetical protein D9619_005861 [Psilocybe cf. subviscida]|uniref:Uncharacterized protein n=1 Tax=Psilocybe cf. subviscida TaxID=2480587 RepID=A0A8H5BYI4_9AGAR|nr:hypothetical protein D9619_005861 [Psilocybe cf. subviscida]
MNAFPVSPSINTTFSVFLTILQAGTRVFFWNAQGVCEYAIVQSSSFLPDGTQILVLKIEGREKTSVIPAAGVTLVG